MTIVADVGTPYVGDRGDDVTMQRSVVEVTTSDGTPIRVRRGLRSDTAALLAGFEHLGEESRYHRFFTAMPILSNPVLDQLTDVDGPYRMAIAAFDPTRDSEVGTDDGYGVGVARCIPSRADQRTAELAVTVIDEYQGRGVGRVLLEALVVGALHGGLTSLYGYVMTTNAPMVHLFGRLGGRDQHVERPEPGVRRLAIDLAAASASMGARGELYATMFR